MANGNGQGVGGIDLRFAGQLQHVRDHHLHLLFVGCAGTDHSLLDLGGRVFGNFQAFFSAGHDGRAAGLPAASDAESALLRHEHLSDAHGHRTVGLDDFPYAAINDLQALVQLAGAGADAARSHVLAAAPGIANHTVTGNARTGVDTRIKVITPAA